MNITKMRHHGQSSHHHDDSKSHYSDCSYIWKYCVGKHRERIRFWHIKKTMFLSIIVTLNPPIFQGLIRCFQQTLLPVINRNQIDRDMQHYK